MNGLNFTLMIGKDIIKRWSKEKGDETITYDISETANKIRARYRG